MELTKYVCDMKAANYMMLNKQKLFLILLVDSDFWRAHSRQVFRFENGAWNMTSSLKVEMWETFLQFEGFFILLAEKIEAGGVAESVPDWTWSAMQSLVDQVIASHANGPLETFSQKATESSDHLRKVTANKTWKASWLRRVPDMLAAFRVQWDHVNLQSLSKLFLLEWDTPLPKSKGVCFEDVYPDDDWNIQPKSPTNDCYMSVPYPFFYETLIEKNPDLDTISFKTKLRLFLESLYYANEHVFEVKLCFLHAAFKKVCTSKMIFEVGKGGDGKGMEAYLERGVLGANQSATFDCGVFLDRQEFRKSGHFAWNQATLILQLFFL